MKKIIMIFMALFMLSGCAKYKMTVNVDEEGKVTSSLKSLISEEALLSQNMTKDVALTTMKTSLVGNNDQAKVEEIKEEIDHKTYYGLSITHIKTSSIKSEVNGDEISVDIPVDHLLSSIKSGLPKNMTLKNIKKLGGEVSIVINMPSDAHSAVGKVDGKQVKVDLLDLAYKNKDVKTIHVTSKKNNHVGMIAGIVLVIMILAGILIVMKRKQKLD